MLPLIIKLAMPVSLLEQLAIPLAAKLLAISQAGQAKRWGWIRANESLSEFHVNEMKLFVMNAHLPVIIALDNGGWIKIV